MGEGMLTMGGGGRIRGKWIRPGGRAGLETEGVVCLSSSTPAVVTLSKL